MPHVEHPPVTDYPLLMDRIGGNLMNFFNRLFGRAPESASIAKERLHLVLAHDRTHISPETLQVLKDELIDVISRHIEIDKENVAVSITRSPEGNRLVADIPVRALRGSRKVKAG